MFSSEQLRKLSTLLLKYLEVKSEIIKVQVRAHIARIVADLLVLFMFIGFAFLIVLLGGFALSFYLNDYLNSSYLGFIIVMGVFFLLSIFMYITRRSLMKTLVYKTISKYFEGDDKLK